MSPKKRLLIAFGVLAVFAIIVTVSVTQSRQARIEVQTAKVERLPELLAKVSASGEIKPKEFVELQAEIVGVITELFVKEGDFVERGELLVRIDPTQSQAEARAQRAILESSQFDATRQKQQIVLQEVSLLREEANVRATQAEVERAKQALELAKNDFERDQQLFEENLISRGQYERARNERVAANAALLSAQAREEQARASLRVAQVVLEQNRTSYSSSLQRVEQNRAILSRAEDSLSKTNIRSPLTGVITQLNVEIGERAVPGTLNNPSATIMVIADLSVIEAEIEVDETDIIDVRLGQIAEIKVDALPDQPLRGVVTEVGSSAIQKPGQTQEAKDFKVAIRLDSPPTSLKPGLSCTSEITTATRNDILAIPIQALATREFEVDIEGNPIIQTDEERRKQRDEGEEEDKEPDLKDFMGVFVVESGRAQFRPTSTGIAGATKIEIRSGLEAGETIITGSYKALRTLRPGDRVEAKKSDERSS